MWQAFNFLLLTYQTTFECFMKLNNIYAGKTPNDDYNYDYHIIFFLNQLLENYKC